MDKEIKFWMILLIGYLVIATFSAIFLPANSYNLIMIFMTIISALGFIIFINRNRGISIKEIFKGGNFWGTLHITILVIGTYLIPLLCVILFPYYIGWIILGLVVIISSYIAINQYHLRKIEIAEKEIERLEK